MVSAARCGSACWASRHNPEGGIRYERLGPIDAVEEGCRAHLVHRRHHLPLSRQTGDGPRERRPARRPHRHGQGRGRCRLALASSSSSHAIAFLSVSIGLINLFPIPMLDGGHLVYYAIEAVRGKPLGPQAQEWGFRIGFSLVIMLMVVGTWNDLVRTADHGCLAAETGRATFVCNRGRRQ